MSPYEPIPQAAQATNGVEELLANMSLRERVGQLNQRMLGWHAVERIAQSSPGKKWRLTDEALREIERWSGLGAIYGLFRADAWSGRNWANGIKPDERLEVVELVQDAVRAASPQRIAALVVEEAPHGHQALGGTILPQNLAMGATWDIDLVREASAAVGIELAASGVDLALVSGLDILRDGRWGRAEECFGESPQLAAEMCRAVVEGMQGYSGQRLGRDGVGVVLKHLAAQGEATGGRNGQSAIIGPRDLREIHLPPVVAGVEAGVVGLMAAYNDIDGIPCNANPWLLTTWLREELGFDGIVMADGLAVDQLLPITGSIPAAGRLALLAGVDLSLWDEGFTTLVESAEADPLVAAAVERACRRVLRVKERLGLLPMITENAGNCYDIRCTNRPKFEPERTQALSHKLAAESLVLLAGEIPDLSTLPTGSVILVVGPNANDITPFLGDYVAPLPAEQTTSVLEQVQIALPQHQVIYADPNSPSFDEAVVGADVTIAVLGGTSHRDYQDEFADNGAAAATSANCGEGVDVADLRLPDGQDDLLRRIRAHAQGPVVSVIVAGRPQVLTDVLRLSDAVVWAGYAGPFGPGAIVEMLIGRVLPTGRLPFTGLRHSGVTPIRHNDRISVVDGYHDVPEPVLLPFASGSMGGAVIKPVTVKVSNQVVTVSTNVVNPTERVISPILPVMVRRLGGVELPRRSELVTCQRLNLAPRETKPVAWRLPLAVVFAEPGASYRTSEITVADTPTVTVPYPE